MTVNGLLLDGALVRAIHSEQLALHGGRTGIRDADVLDSALHRPRNIASYGNPDGPALAASLAFGLARSLPFVVGNKRTAFVAGTTLLELNGWSFGASEADVVVTFLALAAGDLTEDELAAWFRANSQPTSPG